MSNNLTFYDRQKLEYWLRTSQSMRAIARIMRRDHTVLTRELKRNGGGERKKYRADIAQRMFEKRCHQQHQSKLDKYPELKELVIEGLKKEWSPDVIAGKMKLAGQKITISHESIYYYAYNKDGRFEGWYKYLCQGKKKRQKRHARKATKTLIIERKSIHERPEYVNQRERYGDWESDSMLFPNQKPTLSVQSERKSKLIRIHKTVDKTADETNNALTRTIESLPADLFQTFTFDNGSENTKHVDIKKEYGIETYFCDTYASWQKGGVENANKLIRRYLPRNTDMNKMTDRDIYEIQEKINDRPRKCLNYFSPNEIINRVVH